MKLLDAKRLGDLAAALQAAGYRVVAPVEDGGVVRLREWRPGERIVTDAFAVNSAKDFLLPRSEAIARYRIEGNDFEAQDVPVEAPKTALLCVRPCDAASLAAMDTVFNWDYADEFYNARRAATTVITLGCTTADEHCFCTSAGGAPDATAGADAVLRPADGGTRLVLETFGEKGEALAAAAGALLKEGNAKIDPPAEVPERFDAAAVTAWLGENFESPLWEALSLACLGCGACAYACPTCHCFDIQDEGTRAEAVRYRNWDTCGLTLFTAHAGGHNPRPDQSARWRQRVMHKFAYFPERFGMLACTGCGRCGRLCPAGMAISETCAAIDREYKAARK